jgi:galactokinase
LIIIYVTIILSGCENLLCFYSLLYIKGINMAIAKTKKISINSDALSKEAKRIYGKFTPAHRQRFGALLREHSLQFGSNTFFYSSPGRIEVAGNHTDHNCGKVVCAAISLDTLAAVTPCDDMVAEIYSHGYPPVRVDLRDLEVKEQERGASHALVRGVARAYSDRGYKIGGFKATTVSDVFKGAGVSSSAAFEVLVAEIFNDLYNNAKIPAVEKAICSQYAENVYFGKPSGLMDQSAIALGGVSHIDFENPAAPLIKKAKWLFDDLSIVIVNNGGDHAHLTGHYALIREEMENIASHFGKNNLREVNERDFYADIKVLAAKYSERAVLRAIHFFEENKRADAIRQAMAKADKEAFCALINQSGDSSYKLLQNCYPAGEKAQPIPFALTLCSRLPGARATRVHGGGFAGTILNFVDKDKQNVFIRKANELFGKDNVFAINIRDKGTCRLEV